MAIVWREFQRRIFSLRLTLPQRHERSHDREAVIEVHD